jgi:ferric-dicitrate binding protein FerR (iron transport regulator)
MTRRLGEDETVEAAVAAVRADEAPADVASAAADRVWRQVAGAASLAQPAVDHIRGCGDVAALLPDHRAGRLSAPRALLVEDHLRECPSCQARFRQPGRPRLAVLPWRPGAASATPVTRDPRRYLAAAAVLLAAATSVEGVRRSFFAAPPGSRATVETVSGALHRVAAEGAVPLRPGDQLGEAEAVRTAGGSQARIRLSDGSLVELGERVELAVRRGPRDTTIQLERGSVIVQAAKRSTGQLLVASRDCTVRVTGTVFSVNAGLKGSRVSVIEGHVRVEQGRQDRQLQPGQQWASTEAMGTIPVAEEIAWSRDLDKHLALLAEVQALREKWQAVRTPGLRYESPLLLRVPAATLVFASVPNYGETLGEAHRLFEERLRESTVLREWWQEQDPARQGGPSLAMVIERVRSFADFLGDEVALAVVEGQRGHPAPVLLAEVRRPGLREFLDGQLAELPRDGDRPSVRIVEGAVPAGTPAGGVLVLLQPDLVAVGDPEAVRAVTSRAAGDGGLVGTPFGERIAKGYADGVGLLFAADLERITAASQARGRGSARDRAAVRAAGFDGLRHLIVETTALGTQGQSRAALAFAGPRRGLTSWLGAPAPMGSLEFFTPNAQAVAAVLAKSPALVLDDVLNMARANGEAANEELAKLEDKIDLRLRDDLALTLGGEFAVALDGPLLPTPAWKVVVEVTDSARLQASLTTLVSRANEEAARTGRPPLRLDSEQAGERTCHVLRGAGQPFELHYAFADGYLVAGPSRAIVLQAIHTRETGDTFGTSAGLRGLFPQDGRGHVSGLVYQNLGRSLGTLLEAAGGRLTPEQRSSVEALARDTRPSLLVAYGEEDAIQVAGVGGLLDLNPADLSLPLLLGRAVPGTPGARKP